MSCASRWRPRQRCARHLRWRRQRGGALRMAIRQAGARGTPTCGPPRSTPTTRRSQPTPSATPSTASIPTPATTIGTDFSTATSEALRATRRVGSSCSMSSTRPTTTGTSQTTAGMYTVMSSSTSRTTTGLSAGNAASGGTATCRHLLTWPINTDGRWWTSTSTRCRRSRRCLVSSLRPRPLSPSPGTQLLIREMAPGAICTPRAWTTTRRG